MLRGVIDQGMTTMLIFSTEIIQPLLWSCGFASLTVTVISNLCIRKGTGSRSEVFRYN